MQQKQKRRRKSSWDLSRDQIEEAERRLRESKKLLGDPERLLQRLRAGETIKVPLCSDLGLFVSAFELLRETESGQSPLKPDADVLYHLLDFCRRRTTLPDRRGTPRFANALVALSAHHRDWVRPLENWEPDTHNAERQFRSLLRHLIATYDVPPFMDAAWSEGLTPTGVRQQGWYKLIGSGRNIRTADDLPVPLTKKQAHHFLLAPDDLDIRSAFRRAKVIDLGGEERLVRVILATRIGTAFEHEEFWSSVIRFFVAHPSLDPLHYGPILDYLHHQKFEPSIPSPPAGHPEQPALAAPQPNLCMKGRTPEALLRDMREWHGDLARGRQVIDLSWGNSGFEPLVIDEGTGEEKVAFKIVELLTSEDLRQEGAAMEHCVATYGNSCASRRTSIWSLRKRIETGREVRLATIEVNNVQRTIVQVRRRWNKMPTSQELSLLERWGNAGGAKLAYWLAT